MARRPADADYAAFGEPDDARVLAERLDEGSRWSRVCGRERFSHRGRPFCTDPGDAPAPAAAAHPDLGRLHLAAPAAAAARGPLGRVVVPPADARRSVDPIEPA